MSRLAAARSAEAAAALAVVVPVGSLEQHGPHLPLDTDTVIAEAVARGVADRMGGWLAPAIGYGSSGEHQSFPGTSSIGTPVLGSVLVELARSMRTWADQVVFVNGHGGNVEALTGAVRQLVAEGHRVRWVPCAVAGADLHAGRTETSLMLHLRPESVHLAHAAPGDIRPLREILAPMRAGGVAAVSPGGVLGDPTGASAAEGEQLLAQMIRAACASLEGAA